MRKVFLAFVVISFFLFSCNSYQQLSVKAEYISSLNKAIVDGQRNAANWVNSPEDIARHCFPPVSGDGGPKRYEVNKKVESATECIVTLLEEGSIDDEVLGERYKLDFKAYEGHWIITGLKMETKRRW